MIDMFSVQILLLKKSPWGDEKLQEHTSGKPGWWLKFDDVYQYISH